MAGNAGMGRPKGSLNKRTSALMELVEAGETPGEEVKAAIEWLIDADWLRAVEERTGFRVKTTYAINPRVQATEED